MKRPQPALLRLAAALLLLGSAGPAAASGLRTQFGEVVVRNLKIGQTYSLEKLMKLPYRVINTGDEAVDLKVDMVYLATDTMKDGYNRLPSLDWVELSTHEFRLQPNAEAVTDVVIKIPDDASVLGKRFEADIWARTQAPKGVVAVGLASKLLIHVSSERATEAEKKYQPSASNLTNLDFTLYPPIGRAEDVPVGREVNLTKERKVSIKLVNPNDKPMRFKLVSEPNWEALLDRPRGYVDGWDPKYVRPEQDVVEVAGNSLKDVPLIFSVPKEDRFYGRAFFFPISVSVLDQEIPSRVYYKLMVTLEQKPAEKK